MRAVASRGSFLGGRTWGRPCASTYPSSARENDHNARSGSRSAACTASMKRSPSGAVPISIIEVAHCGSGDAVAQSSDPQRRHGGPVGR